MGDRRARGTAKAPAEAVLLVFVRGDRALVLRGSHDREGSLPHGDIAAGESAKEAGRRIVRDLLGVDAKVKRLGEFRMRVGAQRARQIAVLTARSMEDIASTTHRGVVEWQPVAERDGVVAAQFSNRLALDAVREEVETHTEAYRAPDPLTTARRTVLWTLGVVILACALFLGVEIGISWDRERLMEIDVRKAYEYGYFGERSGREFPRPPHGIEGWMYAAVMVPGLFGTAGFALLFGLLARRCRVRGFGWLLGAVVLAGTSAGFSWYSREWIEPSQGGPDGHPILYYGDVWFTALSGGLAVGCLLAYGVGRARAANRSGRQGP